MTNDCAGAWSSQVPLADGTVMVTTCDGCGERMAIYRHRGFDFPAGADERTILTAIWAAVGRSVAAA